MNVNLSSSLRPSPEWTWDEIEENSPPESSSLKRFQETLPYILKNEEEDALLRQQLGLLPPEPLPSSFIVYQKAPLSEKILLNQEIDRLRNARFLNGGRIPGGMYEHSLHWLQEQGISCSLYRLISKVREIQRKVPEIPDTIQSIPDAVEFLYSQKRPGKQRWYVPQGTYPKVVQYLLEKLGISTTVEELRKQVNELRSQKQRAGYCLSSAPISPLPS